jgi:hypothetical protein
MEKMTEREKLIKEIYKEEIKRLHKKIKELQLLLSLNEWYLKYTDIKIIEK